MKLDVDFPHCSKHVCTKGTFGTGIKSRKKPKQGMICYTDHLASFSGYILHLIITFNDKMYVFGIVSWCIEYIYCINISKQHT